MAKDVFENNGKLTNDHIWPIAKDGSKSSQNIQQLTKKSNLLKGDLTKGTINGIRFSITECGRTKSDLKIGRMKIKKNGQWYDATTS